MKNINNIKLKKNSSIKQALNIISKGKMQIALVVDDGNKLVGTLTDGDIRRGLLRGLNLKKSISSIIHRRPVVSKISDKKKDILKLALSKNIHQIPIVDENKKLVGIQMVEELIKPRKKTNKVILMVGGEGVRLRPLTKDVPKPMLHIGNKPILQTIIEKFAEHGYVNIVMCLNYKFQIIKDFFGDGKKFGVKIEYVIEKKKMGTVGALSLLKKKLTKPFFLMNGDLLTDVNFEYLHNYHKLKNNIATISVREHNVELPYGVVKLNQNLISSFEEKPNYKFFINAGVYMFSPEVLNHIPRNKKYQIPELFIKLIKLKKKINTFNLKNYWLDIGQVEQLDQAKKEFNKIF